MRFIPQHENYYDKPWGENGYNTVALNTTLLCLYMANINLFDPTCTSDNISDGLLLHPKMFRIYE